MRRTLSSVSSPSAPCAARILPAKSANRSSPARFGGVIARYNATHAPAARKKTTMPIMNGLILVVHPQQAPNRQKRENVRSDRELQNLLTSRVMEQLIRVGRLDQAEQEQHHDRQAADHHAAKARLRRQRLDLQPQALPDAHDFGKPADYLRQARADFGLYPDRDHQ